MSAIGTVNGDPVRQVRRLQIRKTGPHPSSLSLPTSAFESDSFEPQQFRLMPRVILDAVLGSSTLPCALAMHPFDSVMQPTLGCGASCSVELRLPASVVSVPPLGHVARSAGGPPGANASADEKEAPADNGCPKQRELAQ